VPQTVTVTGVDDLVDDGDIAYGVVVGAPTSSDPIYAAIDPADVAVTNADDDAAGITVTPVAGLGTTEAGGTASFTVVLTSEPPPTWSSRSPPAIQPRAQVSASNLTFTAADWNVPQTVTVTGRTMTWSTTATSRTAWSWARRPARPDLRRDRPGRRRR
jgi:hypothetical protein